MSGVVKICAATVILSSSGNHHRGLPELFPKSTIPSVAPIDSRKETFVISEGWKESIAIAAIKSEYRAMVLRLNSVAIKLKQPIMVARRVGGSRPTHMANRIIKQRVMMTANFFGRKPKSASSIAPRTAIFDPERTMI